MSTAVKEILKLSVSERLEIVETIWDSISNDSSNNDFPLSEEQKLEIEKRRELCRAGENPLYSWDEVKRMISNDEL